MKKKLSFLLSLLAAITCPAASVDHSSTARYLFHQQIDDMCMIAPMLNLHRLETLITRYGYNFPNNEFYSRREWFVLNFPYLLAWHQAFENMNTEEYAKKYPNLHAYLSYAVEYGPVFPHFYQTNGKPLQPEKVYSPNKARQVILEVNMSPYFLIDFAACVEKKVQFLGFSLFSIEDMPGMGISVPVVHEPGHNENDFFIGGVTTHTGTKKVHFDPVAITTEKPQYKDAAALVNNLRHNADYASHKYQGITTIQNTFITPGLLGWDKILRTSDVGKGFMHHQKQFVTYALGLYKLMLLTLGITSGPTTFVDKAIKNKTEQERINEAHNTIAQCTPLASQELHALMNENSQNPWSSDFFSKEALLEHAIARLLKEDNLLRSKVIQTVDFYFGQWSIYTKYLNLMASGALFGTNKQRYYAALASSFLPDEEYTLAYSITKNVRNLWYCAINPQAFYSSSYGEPNPSWILRKGLGVEEKAFRQAAYKRSKNLISKQKISFIDVWQEIVQALKRNHARMNWISFSGHGLVFSFDPTLISLQRLSKNSNLQLLDDLQCTAIESWLSKELHTFYKTVKAHDLPEDEQKAMS